MLDLKLFSESMKRMYLLFDRTLNVEQIDAFYDKLKYNPTTSLTNAEQKIVSDAKRFPTIGDWVSAFKTVKTSSSPQPTGICPKCRGGTYDRKLSDDEHYEICHSCGWKLILYTASEWIAKNGFEGKTMLEISEILRQQRVERGISRWDWSNCQ